MNLLTDGLFGAEYDANTSFLNLPAVFAALVRDEVDTFPALRAHQVPAWHMFLAQLGAIAMYRNGLSTPPTDAAEWHRIIRSLTSEEFPNDEPWTLVVDDHSLPAFMQPPVPPGMTLPSATSTPDALDMLITSKNHDLKRSVAFHAGLDDWIFALISLQTCEGYGGRGNNGIVRMNGGASSRVCLSLAPMPEAAADELAVRPGVRLRRDLEQLATRRAEWLEQLSQLYSNDAGAALLWTPPWPENQGLTTQSLDPLFIEVCRRVRLSQTIGGQISARTGTSDGTRVVGKVFNGVLGDPWAPVNRVDAKSLTIGEDGDFDFTMITKLLSADWQLPLLATLGPDEPESARNWVLIAQAFARGNSKTGGFKERIIPITGKAARGLAIKRPELHQIARFQIDEIADITKVLRSAIALAMARGDRDAVNKDTYAATAFYGKTLRQVADRLFFPALWERLDAEDKGREAALETRARFIRDLDQAAVRILDDVLADLPCPSIMRPRAEARARARYLGGRKGKFDDVEFRTSPQKDAVVHVSA